MMKLLVEVRRKAVEADGIVSLELVAKDGGLPPFEAGAHIDVHLPNGLVRQYSLCNPPTESHRYVIAVLLEKNSRGGSDAVHQSVNEGQLLQISEPRNLFKLVPAKKLFLFAGGIGITPIICMAEYLSASGADFELHYCVRTKNSAAFLNRISNSNYSDRAYIHLDDGESTQRLDLESVIGKPQSDHHIFVCGPQGYIDFIHAFAKTAGWPPSQVHQEYFAAKPTAIKSDESTFSVRIASSGQTITVRPEETIVHALSRHGIEVEVSCEQGICGTCVTRVLDGTPEHRDLFMTDEEHAENDKITLCCSRSQSQCLVLDL